MAVGVGGGTTIVFGTSSFAAELLSCSYSTSRDAVDMTHMGSTTWKEFIPSTFTDPGELTMEIAYDPTVALPDTLVAEVITVSPEGGTPDEAFSGFVTATDTAIPLEDRMTTTITIKRANTITRTLV